MPKNLKNIHLIQIFTSDILNDIPAPILAYRTATAKKEILKKGESIYRDIDIYLDNIDKVLKSGNCTTSEIEVVKNAWSWLLYDLLENEPEAISKGSSFDQMQNFLKEVLKIK